MAEYVYANRFETQLSADIDSTQTNIPVVSTAGAPSPPTNETWFVVFESADTTVWEIAEVTAQTATSLTVARGVDGSTAQAFLAGSKVENRTTAETLQNLLPRATAAALYGDMKSPALQALGELYSAAIADGTQTQSTGLVNTENSVLRYTPLGVPPAHAAGKLFFDSNEDSLVYYNIEPAMSVNIGREGLVRVINLSGATIPNGSAVYVTGANSDLLTVDLAIANSVATSNVLGLTTHDILNTGTGYVTVIGKVGEVNTSTFTAGDLLYLSPSVAGGLTNVRPGNYVTPIGVATIINATTGSVTLYPVYGVPEAPTDGQLYGRRGSDETWQLIPAVSADAVDGPGVPVVDNNFVLWDGTSGTLVSDDGVNVSDFTPASHAADGTIHFTESSIDHTAIQNIGVNTHPQIDTHIGTAGIHFTESSIDHTAIQNIGTNSHPQIDTHIGTANIHFADTTEAVTPQARLAGSWVNVPDTGGSGTVRNATDGTNTSTDKVTWRFVGTGDATATVTDGVAGEAIVTINAAGAVTSLPESPADGQTYGRRGSDTSWQPVYLKTETYSQTEADGLFDAAGAADAAVAAHEAAPDPHPQYLTQTEADGLYGDVSTVGPIPIGNLVVSAAADGTTVMDGGPVPTVGAGTSTTNQSWAIVEPVVGKTYPGNIVTKDPEETVTFESFTFRSTVVDSVYTFEFFKGTWNGAIVVLTSLQPSQSTSSNTSVQEVAVSGDKTFGNQDFLMLQVENLSGPAGDLMVTAKFRRVRA